MTRKNSVKISDTAQTSSSNRSNSQRSSSKLNQLVSVNSISKRSTDHNNGSSGLEEASGSGRGFSETSGYRTATVLSRNGELPTSAIISNNPAPTPGNQINTSSANTPTRSTGNSQSATSTRNSGGGAGSTNQKRRGQKRSRGRRGNGGGGGRSSSLCPCLQQNDSEPESQELDTVGAIDHPPPPSAAMMIHRFSSTRGMQALNYEHGNDSNRQVPALAEPYPVTVVHTQVEYTHYLVPELSKIANASYYWGVMDRFEAEKLLDSKPEGTFILRDSAQSEYLFSVSFRRYQRTLHARIEHMKHIFSFDSYDSAVFNATTVTELIKHYRDPSKCLFFEPLLSKSLPRNFVFSLQHLARAAVCDSLAYNDIQHLNIPRKLKHYLREYHYKQRVRVHQLE